MITRCAASCSRSLSRHFWKYLLIKDKPEKVDSLKFLAFLIVIAFISLSSCRLCILIPSCRVVWYSKSSPLINVIKFSSSIRSFAFGFSQTSSIPTLHANKLRCRQSEATPKPPFTFVENFQSFFISNPKQFRPWRTLETFLWCMSNSRLVLATNLIFFSSWFSMLLRCAPLEAR